MLNFFYFKIQYDVNSSFDSVLYLCCVYEQNVTMYAIRLYAVLLRTVQLVSKATYYINKSCQFVRIQIKH
jgi:hypothetical protein